MKNRKIFFFIFTVATFLVSGCGQDEKIEAYRVPKEKLDSMVLPANHSEASNTAPETPSPQKNPLRWKTPKGWEEKPAGNMRLASFSAPGKNGKADVSIVTLPGEAGGLLANLNRWRGQLALPVLSEKDLSAPGILEKKTFSGQEMTLVDFESIPAPADSGPKKRMAAALFVRENQSYFFKLTGESDTVTEVKPAFLDFLNSLEFE